MGVAAGSPIEDAGGCLPRCWLYKEKPLPLYFDRFDLIQFSWAELNSLLFSSFLLYSPASSYKTLIDKVLLHFTKVSPNNYSLRLNSRTDFRFNFRETQLRLWFSLDLSNCLILSLFCRRFQLNSIRLKAEYYTCDFFWNSNFSSFSPSSSFYWVFKKEQSRANKPQTTTLRLPAGEKPSLSTWGLNLSLRSIFEDSC